MSVRKIIDLAGLAALAIAAACGGAGVKLDPESRTFYEYARLIMTGEEKDVFTHLPDPGTRKEYIQEFWRKRDPDPDTPENEFRDGFYTRIEYANKRFKEGTPGWKTERGRIYIYMGPPDKFDEYVTHDDPDIRGPILWWIYYDYDLGIEFVDQRNTGSFSMRHYTGNFFEALDRFKLGDLPFVRGEKRLFVNFKLDYEPARREFFVRLPSEAIDFRDEGAGFRVDLEFQFFIYRKGGAKLDEFKLEKTYRGTIENTEKLKEISFAVPYNLQPGEYYIDVIITGKDKSLGKTRRIFEVKV